MPSVFSGNHLRVEIPLTKDGINLAYDPVSQKPRTKVVFLPLTAFKHITSKSARLPEHLRYTITKVVGEQPVTNQKASESLVVATQPARTAIRRGGRK